MSIGTRAVKRKVKKEVKDAVGLDNNKKDKISKNKKKDNR